MNNGKYEKRSPKGSMKRSTWLLAAVTALLCVLLMILVLVVCSKEFGNIANDPAATVEKNPDSIAIPGYEVLELKANTTKQSLQMPNPPQNCCFFQISLYLEDGTLLWQSELIEPGKTSKPMVLTKTLDKGMYPNAILRYSCYRMDETLAPLNGAETKLTLWVK